MERRNIDDLIKLIHNSVDQHKIGTGAYCRWVNNPDREMTINEYGCADAANILYTIGEFPSSPEERKCWIDTLRSMQNPKTGLFSEKTHHTVHTTAHCTAALELFDAKPLYKCTAFEKYCTKEGLIELLEDEINWHDPWDGSHIGAGILPSLISTDMIDLEWKDTYFDWLWANTDPTTGFIDHGDGTAPLYAYMAGSFHYFFNHEYDHRPMRYPEKVIDSCISLMLDKPENNAGMHSFIGFIDIDVVYCLTRAMRQSPHRFNEAKTILEDYANKYLDMFYSIDYKNDRYFNDLHSLFGAVCCLAELQAALPGKIITSKPLKLVLDRRPFI